MILRQILTVVIVMATGSVLQGSEYHVSISGSDHNPGTKKAPFRTIGFAAEKARPGDTVTVHRGTYRERIDPPRGGSSDTQRIVYQAAEGAEVTIKGSEIVTGWKHVGNETWTATVPNERFGDHNPYQTKVAGDWFRPLPRGSKRNYHTGSVYSDGHWLKEASTLAEVLAAPGQEAPWFAEVGETNTVIHAQFPRKDPNQHTVEINAREAVFYPEKEGINYLTVRGFIMEHAAPNWSPPTAEQVGLIGTHWSKGWIIEDNIVRYSICTGITLGKHGDEFDNTSANSAEGYVETIKRALKKGWSKENIGSHIVRNNHISHCEQAGIVGSMGAAFSTITGNVIHDINVRGMFSGAEMAGIKFHGAVDTLIADNHVYLCHGFGGIWLDWMTQGTRVTGNLLHDNQRQDLFVEVNHGPFLIDHNWFLSPIALSDQSTGGAYAHNLFAGKIAKVIPQSRETPYLKPHGTEIAGLHNVPCGDNRFLNNQFVDGSTLEVYERFRHMVINGNTFSEARISVVQKNGATYFEWQSVDQSRPDPKRKLVTSDLLGRTKISRLPFEQADGSPYRLDRDAFGDPHNANQPTAGPLAEAIPDGEIKLWPRDQGLIPCEPR